MNDEKGDDIFNSYASKWLNGKLKMYSGPPCRIFYLYRTNRPTDLLSYTNTN